MDVSACSLHVNSLFSSPPNAKICNALFSCLDDVSLATLSLCSKQWATATGVERKYRILRKEDLEKMDKTKLSNLLLEAAACGSLRIVAFAHQVGADVNAKDEEGKTALRLAVLAGSESTVRYLCEHGGDLVETNEQGWTVFHQSIPVGNATIIRLLHSCCVPSQIERKTVQGGTVIMTAAARGNVPIVRLLHRLGADVNAGDNNKYTAIHMAAIFGQFAAVEYLAQNGAEIDSADDRGITPILRCVRMDNFEAVKFLTERGANVGLIKELTCPFFEAISKNSIRMVIYFCEMGAHEANNPERSLLEYAIGHDLIRNKSEVKKIKLTTLAIAIRYAKKKGHKKIVEILAKAPQIRKNALRVKSWSSACLREDERFIAETLEEFLKEGWHEYLLQIVSLPSHPIFFFTQLINILSKRPEHERLIIRVFKKLCTDPTSDTSKMISSYNSSVGPSIPLLHAAIRHGFASFVKTLVDWGMNPRTVFSAKGENAFQYIFKNLSKLPEDQVAVLLDAAGIQFDDAVCVFGVPYSPEWPKEGQHQIFRMYFLKKAQVRLNQMLRLSGFSLWIARKNNENENGIEIIVDTIPHLFLIGHFFRQKNILCSERTGQEEFVLTIPCLPSYGCIMQLHQEQLSEKGCAALTEFASLLWALPNFLERLFPIQWELFECNLRASLRGDHLPVKRKQLQLLLEHISREKNCQLPFEIQFEENNENEAAFIVVSAIRLEQFLKANIACTIVDFTKWKKLVGVMIRDEIATEVQFQGMLTALEKQRIQQQKERERFEKEEQRRVPAQKRDKSLVAQPEKVRLQKKAGKKTNKSKGKGAKQPAAAAPLLQSRPPKDLPPLKVSGGPPLAPPPPFEYNLQMVKKTESSIRMTDARPEPIMGGIELISPRHQMKTAAVQECFNRLHGISQLGTSSGSFAMRLGAMLFNGMLVGLACDSLPFESPLRNLCSDGNTKSVRDFWAHHCFPDLKGLLPLAVYSGHHDIMGAIEPMTEGNFPDKQIVGRAQQYIASLFSEFSSYRISWKTVFSGETPDPRPFLTGLIAQYLSLLENLKDELKTYPENDPRHSYTLDAVTFFVSRIGELVKHLEACSKECRNLRNDTIHCFEEEENAVRETLHAKCLSVLDKLVQMKLSKIDLSLPWEPFINKTYRYSIKLMARILSWRLKELESTGFKAIVHDQPLRLADLFHHQGLVNKWAEEGCSMAVIPLKLADRKLGCLVFHFEMQKVKNVTYHLVDGSREVIPQEVIEFAAPHEVEKVVQAEKKEIIIEDHGPLLVERLFQLALSIAVKRNDKMGTVLQIRKRHLHLAFANGLPELYLKQFFLKAGKKIKLTQASE